MQLVIVNFISGVITASFLFVCHVKLEDAHKDQVTM